MKEIHLHGSLGAHFGGRFSLDVRDPAEAVRALGIQLPGFREAIEADNWHVIRGPLEDGDSLDEGGLTVSLGNQNEIHILPAIEGAGDGAGKVIGGIALVGAAMFIPGGAALAGIALQPAVAGLGISMALGGVSQMLAPTPQSGYEEREPPDQRPSFLFDGPVNTSTQGLPVPVVYGRIKTGSVVVSAGMTAEEIDA
ncbi:MAG: tail assembly protein [Pseudomonadota bacterium]|nr:tail assembly protein [Pseudomonadota bacterium]